jgi:hypothetical protein
MPCCMDCMQNFIEGNNHYCSGIDLKESLYRSRSWCKELEKKLITQQCEIHSLEFKIEEMKNSLTAK